MYNIEVIKNGDIVEISIPDSTFNTEDTSLTLIGRDAVSYGEALNSNMLKLLSNSAGPDEPSQPLIGELWFNTLDQKIYLNSIKGFSVLGSAVWSPTQPRIENSNVGDLWVKSTTRQLYVFGGDTYTLLGPSYDTRNGVTAIVDQVVNDVNGVGRVIGVVRIADNDVGFFSNEPFSYPGYGEVVRGFNPLGGDFTINASILSAKNLERGGELIPASDVAVKGEDANFTTLSASSAIAQTVQVGNIVLSVENGTVVVPSTVNVNKLEINDVEVSSTSTGIAVQSVTTESVITSSASVNTITSNGNISVQQPLILNYEETEPSENEFSATTKKFVVDVVDEVKYHPLTVTMHTPALNIATLHGAIVQYLTKLFPPTSYEKSTKVRVLAVQTQVKNKLIVSDYDTATVHVYEMQDTGWQYMYSEE